jgi:hypothetical protein
MKDNIEFVAFVGLDWDSQQHAACILPAAGGKPQHREVPQTPEAIAQWVAELREQFPEGFIAVCLEQARGALVYALMQYSPTTAKPSIPAAQRAIPTTPNCWPGFSASTPTSCGPGVQTTRSPVSCGSRPKNVAGGSKSAWPAPIACNNA